MFVGDHPLTAVAIAKKVGIIDSSRKVLFSESPEFFAKSSDCKDVKVTKKRKSTDFTDLPSIIDNDCALAIRGSDIGNFTENSWNWVLGHEQIVFARTLPEQKLKIVKECQRLGFKVAVTGKPSLISLSLTSLIVYFRLYFIRRRSQRFSRVKTSRHWSRNGRRK